MLSFLIVLSESFDIIVWSNHFFFGAKGTHRAQKRHRKLRSYDNIAFDRPELPDEELKATENNVIYFWSRKISVNCNIRLKTYQTNIVFHNLHFNRV